MRKSLALQAEMAAEFGACVFDVTLDCEDGAPAGGEAEHAALVAELALGAAPGMRVGARVHPVDHPAFEADVATIAGRAGARLSHLMLPKVESVADVARAVRALDAAGAAALPLHALIESPLAVRNAFDIAAHARVQSLQLHQGPWQRRLGLADLQVDSPPGPVKVRARHRDAPEARALLEQENEVARRARATRSPGAGLTG